MSSVHEHRPRIQNRHFCVFWRLLLPFSHFPVPIASCSQFRFGKRPNLAYTHPCFSSGKSEVTISMHELGEVRLARLGATDLKNMVGISFHFLDVEPALLITAIWTSSMISIAATGIPARMTFEAAAAASRMVGNVTTATLVSSGITVNFSVISVTIPRVPSEPMNKLVRLYPAADLLRMISSYRISHSDTYRGRRLVLMMLPSARTTVRLMTQSFIVPYLTAFVPLPGNLVLCRHANDDDVHTCNWSQPCHQFVPVADLV